MPVRWDPGISERKRTVYRLLLFGQTLMVVLALLLASRGTHNVTAVVVLAGVGAFETILGLVGAGALWTLHRHR